MLFGLRLESAFASSSLATFTATTDVPSFPFCPSFVACETFVSILINKKCRLFYNN